MSDKKEEQDARSAEPGVIRPDGANNLAGPPDPSPQRVTSARREPPITFKMIDRILEGQVDDSLRWNLLHCEHQRSTLPVDATTYTMQGWARLHEQVSGRSALNNEMLLLLMLGLDRRRWGYVVSTILQETLFEVRGAIETAPVHRKKILEDTLAVLDSFSWCRLFGMREDLRTFMTDLHKTPEFVRDAPEFLLLGRCVRAVNAVWFAAQAAIVLENAWRIKTGMIVPEEERVICGQNGNIAITQRDYEEIARFFVRIMHTALVHSWGDDGNWRVRSKLVEAWEDCPWRRTSRLGAPLTGIAERS